MSKFKLRLYFGRVDSNCLPEGGLEHQDQQTKIRAFNYVLRELDRAVDDDYYLGTYMDSIFKAKDYAERKAREFIKYAKENIKGTETEIDLDFCKHGKLFFGRDICFNNWNEENKSELVEKIKAGLDINPDDKDRLIERDLEFIK